MGEPGKPNLPFRPKGKGTEKLSLRSASKTALLNSVPSSPNAFCLGESIAALSTVLKNDVALLDEYSFAGGDLDEHRAANRWYVEASEVNALSCSQSVKRWAIERLSPLKFTYEVKNRLKPKQDEENADALASRKLLELAEDFFQISSFCRDLKGLHIEMSPHAAGMEFLFEFVGDCERQELRNIEDQGMNVLFSKYSRENSMRLRANISDEFAEIQVVVFRANLRLGMSPVAD